MNSLTINQKINSWIINSEKIREKGRTFYICTCVGWNKQHKVNKDNLVHNKSKCCRNCSRSYLWSETEVINEIKKIINQLNNFPSKAEMMKFSPQMISQINKLGGINKFRDLLNQKIIKRKRNYWQDFEKLKYHLNKNFENLISKGIFPTQSLLSSVSLSMPVHKHGGSKAVAEKLNCKIDKCLITSDGHYVNSGNEYIVDEFLSANKIPHEVNGRISNLTKHSFDFKIDDYYVEIWGFENSDKERCKRYQEKRKIKEELYKSLNLKLISIEKEIFGQPLEKINSYLVNLFSNIKKDIKEIDIKNASKCCRFWNDENITIEFKILVEKLGHFPKAMWLQKNKRCDLINAARRNGGLTKFKNIILGESQ